MSIGMVQVYMDIHGPWTSLLLHIFLKCTLPGRYAGAPDVVSWHLLKRSAREARMVICMTASLVFNPGLLYVCISETMCDIFKKLCEWPLYIWHLIMLVNVDPPILLRTARQ